MAARSRDTGRRRCPRRCMALRTCPLASALYGSSAAGLGADQVHRQPGLPPPGRPARWTAATAGAASPVRSAMTRLPRLTRLVRQDPLAAGHDRPGRQLLRARSGRRRVLSPSAGLWRWPPGCPTGSCSTGWRRPRRLARQVTPRRGPAVNTVSSVPGDQGQDQAAGQQRQHHAVAGERRVQAHAALLAAPRAQLAAVCLHVSIEFPRVVGNLDVDRRETRVVPFRFAAKVHKHLSGKSERSPQYEPAGRRTARAQSSLHGRR